MLKLSASATSVETLRNKGLLVNAGIVFFKKKATLPKILNKNRCKNQVKLRFFIEKGIFRPKGSSRSGRFFR